MRLLPSCSGLFVYCPCKMPQYCLQAGEGKLVLEIGQAALRRTDSKPFVHDVLLAMALAEVRATQEIKEKWLHDRIFMHLFGIFAMIPCIFL